MKYIFFFSSLLIFLIIFVFKVRISINVSDSMPRGIYLMTGILGRDYKKNSIVIFCPSKEDMDFFLFRKYIFEYKNAVCYDKYPPFVKYILAKENDVIEIWNNNLYLNKKYVEKSHIFNNDSRGRNIFHLKNGYKKTLSKDEFFVFSFGVSRSLDSRYLGLINRKEIISKSHLIWRFN